MKSPLYGGFNCFIGMNLFTLKNYKVYISEEAYLLAPFKKLWDRDKSQNKSKYKDYKHYAYNFHIFS